ncbi:MAG TPA: shikimate kinase [Verrucomicrobiae bacterium]
MNDTRDIRNLALIGFMGTGKSVVGQFVAEHLRFEFVDTDALVEQQAGRKIAEIFRDEGEPAFRERERAVVQALAARSCTVIATGGGLVTYQDNLALLKSHALVVCLWASPEAIYERVRSHDHRPLLHDPDPLARIRNLLALREPFYRQADVLINAEFRTVPEVGLQVLHQFQGAGAGSR